MKDYVLIHLFRKRNREEIGGNKMNEIERVGECWGLIARAIEL